MPQQFISLTPSKRLRLLTNDKLDGTPLLCLHGFTGKADPFESILNDWPGPAWAYDQRGHGWSTWSDSYTIRDYASDAIAILDHLGLNQALLYGHSLGGLTSLALASWHPSRIRGVIAEDPPILHRNRSVQDMRNAEFFKAIYAARLRSHHPLELLTAIEHFIPQATPEEATTYAQRYWNCDPNIFPPVIDDTLFTSTEIDELFQQITTPCLLLQGNEELGAVLRNDDLESLRKEWDDWEHEFFPDSGHSLRTLHHAKILQLSMEFTKRHGL